MVIDGFVMGFFDGRYCMFVCERKGREVRKADAGRDGLGAWQTPTTSVSGGEVEERQRCNKGVRGIVMK